MSDGENKNPAAGRVSWKSVVLVASLGLNLLVAGAVVTHWFHGHASRGGVFAGPGYQKMLPRKFFSDLDQTRRQELRDLFRAQTKQMRGDRRQLRAAGGNIADALAAEPYDASAVNAAVAGFADVAKTMLDDGVRPAETFFAALSADERKALAKHIRKRLKKDRSGRKRRGSD